MTTKEIAAKIDAYLKRFEATPEINRYDEQSAPSLRLSGLRPYHNAHAWAVGRFVRVTYISYQGSRALTKPEAEAYLAWLDAGGVGSHHAPRRAKR